MCPNCYENFDKDVDTCETNCKGKRLKSLNRDIENPED